MESDMESDRTISNNPSEARPLHGRTSGPTQHPTKGQSTAEEVQSTVQPQIMPHQPFRVSLAGPLALQRLKELQARRKKADGGPREKKEKDDATNSPPPTDSWIQKKKKRTDSSDSTNMSDDTIKLSFPSNASAQSNFEPLRGEVEKLLFPKDREMFEMLGLEAVADMGVKAAFQGLQTAIWMDKEMESLSAQVEALTSERNEIRAEAESLKSSVAETERLKEELQAQLEAQKEDASRAEAELRAKIAILQDRTTEIALETEIRVRAKMAREYMEGKAGTWDTAKYISDDEELKRRWNEEDARATCLAASFGEMTTGEPRVGG